MSNPKIRHPRNAFISSKVVCVYVFVWLCYKCSCRHTISSRTSVISATRPPIPCTACHEARNHTFGRLSKGVVTIICSVSSPLLMGNDLPVYFYVRALCHSIVRPYCPDPCQGTRRFTLGSFQNIYHWTSVFWSLCFFHSWLSIRS